MAQFLSLGIGFYCVTISCVSGFTAKCNFRHVRRFVLPCFRIFHSPSPKTFKPSAVHDHVDRSCVFPNVQRYAQFASPLGQRREIRNIKVDLHQFRQRFSQSFRLAIRQLKQLPQNQQAFDCRIAVYKRVSDLGFFVVMTPFFNCFFAKPERNRASINQRLVVFSPICYFVRTFPFPAMSNSFYQSRGG